MTPQKRRNLFIILILGALSTITPFAIDLYLPAFPQIANDLNTSTARVSLSVSSYFIGIALGQILYGPLLDRYGRKKPLYVGLLIFLLATIGCLSSNSVEELIAIRFLQALGGCAAQVVAMTMVRDFFSVRESSKVISLLVLILGVAPLVAPPLGSFIAISMGWQAVFASLAVLVSLIFMVTYLFLPDGQKPDPSVTLAISPIFRTYTAILKEPRFYTYALAGAFSFAGLFVYIAGSPVIFMDIFKVSPNVYGGIFALLAFGFIVGGQLNIFLSKRMKNERIFTGALLAQTLFGFIFFVGHSVAGYGLDATVVLLFGILVSLGCSYPNAAALALAPFSKNAGSASALLGFFQIGIAALASSGIGFIEARSVWPMAALFFGSPFIGLFILFIGRRRMPQEEGEGAMIYAEGGTR